MKKYFFSIALCVLVLFNLEAQTVAAFDFDCEDPKLA